MAGATRQGEHGFTAKIERRGTLYAFAVPLAVVRAIRSRWARREGGAYVPVVAIVQRGDREVRVRATLVPSGGGRAHVHLNGRARKALGAALSDAVKIVLCIDREPRDPEVASDLARALEDAGARAAFDAFPAG